MADVECIFCNEMIPEEKLEAHCATHRLEPVGGPQGWEGQQRGSGQSSGSGQQPYNATLPPAKRDRRNLRGVPQVYRHLKCEATTHMPEEMVRTYLAEPWFYRADQMFCSGCSAYVPISECVWAETGENLQHYMDRLREIYDRMEKQRFYAAEVVPKDDDSILKRKRFWVLVAAGLFGCMILIAKFTNSRVPSSGGGVGIPIPRFRGRRR